MNVLNEPVQEAAAEDPLLTWHDRVPIADKRVKAETAILERILLIRVFNKVKIFDILCVLYIVILLTFGFK